MSANLILADDNSATRSALAFILSRRLGLSVAGEAASMDELLRLIGAKIEHPRVLVLDWDLPGLAPQRSLSGLRELDAAMKIVVLSARADAKAQALAAGADAFVSMVEPPEVMLSTIHQIAANCAEKEFPAERSR